MRLPLFMRTRFYWCTTVVGWAVCYLLNVMAWGWAYAVFTTTSAWGVGLALSLWNHRHAIRAEDEAERVGQPRTTWKA